MMNIGRIENDVNNRSHYHIYFKNKKKGKNENKLSTPLVKDVVEISEEAMNLYLKFKSNGETSCQH